MKTITAIFLLFLFAIVCFSIYHIISQKIVPSHAYIFSIVSLLVFCACFLLIVLNVKIGGKYVSLQHDIDKIKTQQEELSVISTTLYKLFMLGLVISRQEKPSQTILDKHLKLTNRLNKYLDIDDISEFTGKLFD